MSNSIGNNAYNPKINYIINPSDYIIIDLNKQIFKFYIIYDVTKKFKIFSFDI